MAQPTFNLDRVLRNSTTQTESTSSFSAMPEKRLVLIVVGAIFTLVGVLANLCRLITILQRRRGAWWDDFAAFAAFAFSIAFAAATFVSVRWGVGLQASDVPSWWAVNAVKAGIAVQVLYFFSIFAVKVSILLLYLRLAKELRDAYQKLCVGLLIVLAVQFIATIIVAAAQCIPMRRYWDPAVEGHCIDVTVFIYATNTFTIVTDLVILALPMPYMLKIKRQRAQTVGLGVAFIAGGLSVAASCLRLYSIIEYASSVEPLEDAAPIYTWSFIEIGAGLCCASVAVITPLFTAYSVRLSAIISPIEPPNRTDSFANYAESWPYGRTAPMGRYSPAEEQHQSPRVTDSLSDLDPPRDIEGNPFRISKPLPELPRAHYQSHSLTALPQTPNQPMLYAIATYNHNSTDPTAPVYKSRAREEEVRELKGAGLW